VGVPCILGQAGLEEVVELALTEDELAGLRQSAEHVRTTVADWERLRG